MWERLEKMDRRTLVAMVVAVVLGIMLFGAISSGIRQAGWNEGFLVGQLSSSTEGGQAVQPYLAARGYGANGWGGHGWHPFGIIGGFFRVLFFGFLIMLAFKFFAFRRWARHGYPGGQPGGPWGHHGRHHWGQHGEQSQQSAPTPQTQPQPGNSPASDPLPGAMSGEMPNEMKGTQNTSWTQL